MITTKKTWLLFINSVWEGWLEKLKLMPILLKSNLFTFFMEFQRPGIFYNKNLLACLHPWNLEFLSALSGNFWIKQSWRRIHFGNYEIKAGLYKIRIEFESGHCNLKAIYNISPADISVFSATVSITDWGSAWGT